MNNLELKKMANEVRKGIVTAVHSAKAGHPGGSLSAADIFTYLYFEEMNIDPADPGKADRDRFVLSKGHTARDIPVCSIFPVWICQADLLGRVFPQQQEWHLVPSWIRVMSEYIHSLEMVRSRRDRYGRHPCLPDSVSWTTW